MGSLKYVTIFALLIAFAIAKVPEDISDIDNLVQDEVGLPAHVQSIGCYQDHGNWKRALWTKTNDGNPAPNIQSGSTVELCLWTCSSSQYFAVQDGGQCWCGSTNQNSGTKYGTSTACNGGLGGP